MINPVIKNEEELRDVKLLKETFTKPMSLDRNF